MDYGFTKSVYLKLRFRNSIGLEYIQNNFIYVIALVIGWSRLVALFGLMHQLMFNQLNEKATEWFISGFLLAVGLFLLIVERFAIQDRIGFRHMVRKFVRHTHHK